MSGGRFQRSTRQCGHSGTFSGVLGVQRKVAQPCLQFLTLPRVTA